MKRTFLSAAFLLAGCANATGQPCASAPCPAGYECQPIVGDVNRCQPICNRRSDCHAPAACVPGFPHGFCDEGDRRLSINDECSLIPGQLSQCAQGLDCEIQTARCLPRCWAFSPHAEDRTCPAGYRCDSSRRWPEERSNCLPECDPSIQNSCRDVALVCVRYQDATGTFGICTNALSGASCTGLQCEMGTVCVEGVCHDPRTAPAQPWNQPVIPPPID